MSVDEMEVDVPEVTVDPSEEIRAQFPLLERAVAQFDTRFTLRAIRSISSLRKQLSETKIASLDVKKPVRELLAEAEKQLSKAGEAKKESIPEFNIYLGILLQVGVHFYLPLLTH
jgi:26S proteasome regulatory subunit N3